MIDTTYAVNCLKQGFQRYIKCNKINATIDCGDNYVSFYAKDNGSNKQYLARGSNHHLRMQNLADKDEPWNGDNISIVFIAPNSPQDTRIRPRVQQKPYGGIKPFDVTTYQYDNTILDERDLSLIFRSILSFLDGNGYNDPFNGTHKAAKVIPIGANIKPYKEPTRKSRNISVDKNGNYVSASSDGADYVSENKQYKTNTNMNKKLIRLTESELRNMIAESVKRVLNEDESTSKMAYGIFDTKGSLSNNRRPSKITKVDRSNSSNKRTMSPDEIQKIHNIVSEVSVAPNGHRFDPNKRDGDFPIEQPEWTKDPRWQGWNGEDPEWIMKQQEKYPYSGETKQSVRVSEAQLHQIVKESVQRIMNEAWYNNWGDFKRGARNVAVGAAMAASTAAPLASCYQNNVQQTQNQPKVEYSQQVDPAYQMGKELVDIYNNYPLSTQQVKQKYGDQITNSFQYNGSQSLTKQQVQEYQRVGSKWTIVGNNGNGTFTVFFLR